MTKEEKTIAKPEQKAETSVDRQRQSKRQKHARVTVFGNWCKGCGLCVAFCPKQVFEEDEESHPVVAHPERCTACNWCTMHCPDFAIVVHVEDEREMEGDSTNRQAGEDDE